MLVSQHTRIHTHAAVEAYSPSDPLHRVSAEGDGQPRFLYDTEAQQKHQLQSGDGEHLRQSLLNHFLTSPPPLTRILSLTHMQAAFCHRGQEIKDQVSLTHEQ